MTNSQKIELAAALAKLVSEHNIDELIFDNLTIRKSKHESKSDNSQSSTNEELFWSADE